MSETKKQMEMTAPLEVPLPGSPSNDHFSDEQWRTLLSIMDTVVPAVYRESTTSYQLWQLNIPQTKFNAAVDHLKATVADAPSVEQLDPYLEERPSEIPLFQDLLKRILVHYSRDDARKGLGVVLSGLNTRVGSFIMTGYTTPFHEQSIQVREQILRGWRTSYIAPLNQIFKSMTFLAKNVWLKSSPNFEKLAGYPSIPQGKRGSHYEYKFDQFEAGEEPAVFKTDVVIVGSGCGGAVCAKNLAEAGHKVLVVEKSYYWSPAQLPMTEASGGVHLFDNGGVTVTDDGSLNIIAGSTWGGGGTVNWSASLQPQEFVRKEWAQDRGLTFFESAEFQKCLDRVCHRMGVSTEHIRHNHGNQMLLEGARKLGYTAKAVPQNTGGTEHYCGSCHLGCAAAGKQGPIITWLPDAGKAGAKFIEGFKVDQVLFDETSGKKVAIGVKGTWVSRNSKGGVDGPLSDRVVREVVVKAKKVIVSCGTLWSPIVLLNSGLKNHQIGRNTYLHPVNMVAARYEEDVRPWEGSILTSVCTSFENQDGHGHGVKIETQCMLPSLFMTLVNWDGGFDFKMRALQLRHFNGFIIIARDRDTGRIYPDAETGVPRIAYTTSAFDRAHVLNGVIATAKMCYVTGAREIHVMNSGIRPYIRSPADASGEIDLGIHEPRFVEWLELVRSVGNSVSGATWVCAHQMGSNRMSTRQQDGVVDPKGKVWGTEGLYVSDASVFPSASGVNPMVTNMAISDWISRGVSKDLLASKEA